jgi:L,D-peptidoglycan transpeptidase YkuD (ErfK/YbiS/YcfS/YnhG family)
MGTPIPVVVGWGGVGPKQEGDGRSPQGVFELGQVFGYTQEPPTGAFFSSGSGLPYEPMAPGSICVDDPGSAYYGQIFDPDTLPEPARGARDWKSAEAMRRDLAHGDGLYRWGVVVRYNDEGVPGAGSCIFLHVWRGPQYPTAGCTAMAEEDLLSVLGWLRIGSEGGSEADPESVRGPVLIQGTRAYLESLGREGVLPYPVPG